MTTAALVLPPTIRGKTDASTTRSARNAVDAQLRVDNGVRVAAHATGADRMVNRVGRAADMFRQCFCALRSRARLHLQRPIAREGGRRDDPARDLEATQSRRQVVPDRRADSD